MSITETRTEPDEAEAAGFEYDPEAIARTVAAWVQARQGQG